MTTLRYGSRGAEVKALQLKLAVMADGIFGAITLEAVKEFQKSHGLTADGIVGAKTWAALNGQNTILPSVGTGSFPLTGNPTKKRVIDEIIIHYAATPQGEDFTVDQVRQSHLANGWTDIGYHWYVDIKGKIWKGRSEDIAGAHCKNHNTRSIGISYAGGCPPRTTPNWNTIGMDTRTPAQKEALLSLVKELKRKYPKATVHGHREFANKPCPGFDAKEEYKNA